MTLGTFQLTVGLEAKTKDNFYGISRHSKHAENDTYLKVYDQENKKVYHSELIKNENNPTFKPFTLKENMFNADQLVKFEVWDKDTLSKDDLIGIAQVEYPFIPGAKYKIMKRGEQNGVFRILEVVKPMKIPEVWIDNFNTTDDTCFYTISRDKNTKRPCFTSETVTGVPVPIFEDNVGSIPSSQSLWVDFYKNKEKIASGYVPCPFVFGEYKLTGKQKVTLVIGEALKEFSFFASADGLKNMDWIGKSDPIFTVKYDGKTVFRSEESDDYAAPVWGKVWFKGSVILC